MTPRYRAFLSYSHADEAAATKLHRALEHYTLPRRVRKAYALPARLTPIFRDVEELEAASGLNTRLQDALDESRWLIVLCSPASAKSKYVNAEIEYFLSKHGPERVLCVLLAGEPPECFPPAIRALADEPLAADLRLGRDEQLARIKLIAALAGVGFTELRNREATRRRRNRILACATLAFAAVGGGLCWDLFRREHVDYYVNYVRRAGIWEGVDHLSAEVASHRSASYRFTRHGRLNPPDRVDYVNASGSCAGDGIENTLGETLPYDAVVPANRYCSVTFEYSRDGVLRRENLLNGIGRPKETLSYTADDLAQFTQQGFALASQGSGVNYVQFSRDASGFDAAVHFLFSRGVPRPNKAREFGLAFTRDTAGRILTRQTLDNQGKATGELVRYSYAPVGDLQEIRYEDAKGTPRLGPEGYAVQRMELDAYGNAVRKSYWSTENQPTLNADHYADAAITYDARGNPVVACYRDAEGKPIRAGSMGAECDHRRYDDRGRVVAETAFDAEGHRTAGTGSWGDSGESSSELSYDASGNVAEIRHLDKRDQLVEGAHGFALERFKHDERGNEIEEEFFGADGKPAQTNYGAAIRHEYDLRDNFMEWRFVDADGNLFLRPDVGFALMTIKRDERGNLVEVAFFDAGLKPVKNKRSGSAVRAYSVDELGNIVEHRSLDTNRQPVRDVNGVAIYRREYDRLGQLARETCFDEAQKTALHKDGYHGYTVQFDHRGREVERRFIDRSGQPMIAHRFGSAGVRYEYDTLGRPLRETYLDVGGQPLSGARVQKMEYQRDAFGFDLEHRYYTQGERLVLSPGSGCAVETREYDPLGRLIREQCLDPQRHATNRTDEGWAVKNISWVQGRREKEELLDAVGREVKSTK